MEQQKDLYSYSGAVYYFDTLIFRNWEGTTYAVSEKKARNNLAYQFKTKNGYVGSVRITLPDKVIRVVG